VSAGFSRHATDNVDSADLRKEAYAAFNAIDDPAYRAVVGLLVRILDAVEIKTDHMYSQLDAKLDAILKDEKSVKHMVLNDHTDTHDSHHRWIDTRIKNGGHCTWASTKIKAEEVSAADRRGIKNAVLEKVLIALLAGGAGLMVPQLVRWFQ